MSKTAPQRGGREPVDEFFDRVTTQGTLHLFYGLVVVTWFYRRMGPGFVSGRTVKGRWPRGRTSYGNGASHYAFRSRISSRSCCSGDAKECDVVAICFVKKDTDKQVTWGTRCSHQRAAASTPSVPTGMGPFCGDRNTWGNSADDCSAG